MPNGQPSASTPAAAEISCFIFYFELLINIPDYILRAIDLIRQEIYRNVFANANEGCMRISFARLFPINFAH
jgi:hypothetical protein